MTSSMPFIKHRCRRKRTIKEPADKDSFGYTLWAIVGGEVTNRKKVAELLGISSRSLGEIFHGKWKPTQDYINKRNWDRKLAKKFPVAWRENKKVYKERKSKLQKARSEICEPENKESFGYAVYLILGEKDADIDKAVLCLNKASLPGQKISASNLRSILYGAWRPSQAWLEKNNWRGALIESYPDGWGNFGHLYDGRVVFLSKRSYVSKILEGNQETNKPVQNTRSPGKRAVMGRYCL
ncbi:MAG: helix-turn-helix transcriptional regulator [Bdellovibrionales bacterium]